ncbi:hypothetical protein Anapl_13241 [Anas platyrhynchos]|uniref:Uncharacterized protein n=1 Tax=Anas platyrhynchos TaxID=8839 RepID=R0K9W0_ANAPL|nr:hypothetical protein Anapl_13241 [Anas platyrhynchos]
MREPEGPAHRIRYRGKEMMNCMNLEMQHEVVVVFHISSKQLKKVTCLKEHENLIMSFVADRSIDRLIDQQFKPLKSSLFLLSEDRQTQALSGGKISSFLPLRLVPCYREHPCHIIPFIRMESWSQISGSVKTSGRRIPKNELWSRWAVLAYQMEYAENNMGNPLLQSLFQCSGKVGSLEQVLLIAELMNSNWSLKKQTLEECMCGRNRFLQGLGEKQDVLWGKCEFLLWQEKAKGQNTRKRVLRQLVHATHPLPTHNPSPLLHAKAPRNSTASSFDMSVVLPFIHRIQLSLFGPALHLFLPASSSGTEEGEWLLFALLHWSLTDVEDLYSVKWSTALSSSANHSLCVSPIPSKPCPGRARSRPPGAGSAVHGPRPFVQALGIPPAAESWVSSTRAKGERHTRHTAVRHTQETPCRDVRRSVKGLYILRCLRKIEQKTVFQNPEGNANRDCTSTWFGLNGMLPGTGIITKTRASERLTAKIWFCNTAIKTLLFGQYSEQMFDLVDHGSYEDHISITDQVPTNAQHADCCLSECSKSFIGDALALPFTFYKPEK